MREFACRILLDIPHAAGVRRIYSIATRIPPSPVKWIGAFRISGLVRVCSSEEKKTEAGDDDVLELKFALGWISFISALVTLHAAFQNSKVNMNLSSQRCYRVQFGWSVSCVSFWVCPVPSVDELRYL